MQKFSIFAAAAGILVSLIPAVQATVIDVQSWVIGRAYEDPSHSEHTLSFDYDLQQLTITGIIYDYEIDFDDGHLRVSTSVDSYPTTFSVVWNVTNNTGVTWTGYDFIWGWTLHGGGPANIVPESIESTRLRTVYAHDYYVGLSGPPVVPDGESLTIEFNLSAPQYLDICTNMFQQHVIPEPTTMTLLGLSGLVLLRNRRRVKV